MFEIFLLCFAVVHSAVAISVQYNNYSHEEAYNKLIESGIQVKSRDNCNQRKECVSLEGIRKEAIDGRNGVIELKRVLFNNRNRVAGCDTDSQITVIGGTEVGKGTGMRVVLQSAIVKIFFGINSKVFSEAKERIMHTSTFHMFIRIAYHSIARPINNFHPQPYLDWKPV